MYTVYMHINKSNGKKYVGQTCQKISDRWGRGSTYVSSNKFYNAIKKYGWEGFNHFIIKEGLTHDEANYLERRLIEKYETITNGYNISNGGSGVMRGRKHSDDARLKIKEARANQKINKEHRLAQSAGHRGFSGRKIVVTFQDGNIRKYDIASEISEELNITLSNVYRVLKDERKSVCKLKIDWDN